MTSFPKLLPANRCGAPTIFLLTGLWLILIGFGSLTLFGFETQPGAKGSAPGQWPARTSLALHRTRPTLLLFAHPKCPCTRATLGELALLMASCQGKVSAVVLFTKPPGVSGEWVESGLWHDAQAIPNVSVVRDDEGVEARRFGALTSGDTMLFSPEGKLLFHGGMTEERGHSGDNDGRSALFTFIQHGSARRVATPVYGCPLFGGRSEERKSASCPP